MIPTCSTVLVLGDTDLGIDVDVYIFVENLTTGRIHRIPFTTLANGRVTLTMSDPDQHFYNENSTYDVHVTKQSDTINMNVDLTIEGTDHDCVNVNFTNLFDDNDDRVAYSSHSLELEN